MSMQEAERCSNYLRQPAFQGGKSSSVLIIFAKAIFLCVSRQPGCDVVPVSTSALKLDTSLRGFAITAET